MKLFRAPTRRTLVGKTVRKSIDGTWLGKSTKLGMLIRSQKTKLFLSVYVDDIRMAGKKQNSAPMWKKLMKDVDIEEPISFLDHVYLGCTQREFKPNEKIIGRNNKMFESRISAGASEKFPGWDKLRAKTSAWSYDMERLARKCLELYCELANKKTERLYKVSQPCFDDHQIKQEELENKGELSEVYSRIEKCLYLARTGRPDILWSVNKLARSVTKWNQACDGRLARLISYIHFTSDYRQYCHLGNAAQHCRLGFFQDSDFAGHLEDSKSTSGGVLCIFGSRTFVPISWMCKKQTSVSHISTESEILSLDAGLRMDGIPALDLWDLVTEVLEMTQRIPKPTQACTWETGFKTQITPKIEQVLDQNVDLSNTDHVPSNAHLSEKES